MLRNFEASTKKSTTECKISKNRAPKDSHGSIRCGSNSGYGYGYNTKNGHSRISRSEAVLKNANCNKTDVDTLASGKGNQFALIDHGSKPKKYEGMEMNLLSNQTPARNIQNIFYKEISDCLNEMKNTSLLIDVVKSSTPYQGRYSWRDRKYGTILRRKTAYDNRKSSPKEAPIFCGFNCRNTVTRKRPHTTPSPQNNNSEVEVLTKSISGSKLLFRQDFLSKIPVLARYLKTKGFMGNIEKIKTSPELKFRGCSRCKTNSINSDQKHVELSANIGENCKRVYGKIKTPLSEDKLNNFSTEADVKKINVSGMKSVGVDRSSSFQPIMKKSVLSRIPRTISSLGFSSTSKIANDVGINQRTGNAQQKLVSRIPVGVKSSMGIINKECFNDVCQDVQSSRGTSSYHEMPVTKGTPAEDLKVRTPPTNPVKSSKNNISNRIHRKDWVCNSRMLEAKKGAENICKEGKLHFCCGDRNNDRVLCQKFPGKVKDKVTKSRKTSNFKHRVSVLVDNKVDDKPTVSPETRIAKLVAKESLPEVQAEKLANEEQPNQIEYVLSEICNLPIPKHFNSFSDTNLLELRKNCSLKSFSLRRRCTEFLTNETYTQTTVGNNNIGVQVDFCAKNLDRTEDINWSSSCDSLNSEDIEFSTFSQLGVGANGNLSAILDYCSDLLKTQNELDEVLTQCSIFQNVSSLAIGCQSEKLPLIDSFAQTSCCAADKGCQCYQATHTIRFTFTNFFVPVNTDDVYSSHKNTSERESGFKTSLDGGNYHNKMACHCKETPLDQKADIEEKRPRNLYEDDEEGDEYSEPYMGELVNTVYLEDETKLCGSTPSLPEVVVGNDRCESKLEIPWLKISLAPPGYYQIKNKEGHPNKVVCDCWALSTGDDVYVEGLERKAEVSGPEVCTCKYLKSANENKQIARTKLSKMSVERGDVQGNFERKPNAKHGEKSKNSNNPEEGSSAVEDTPSSLADDRGLVEEGFQKSSLEKVTKPPPSSSTKQPEQLLEGNDPGGTEDPPSDKTSSSSIPSDCLCFQENDECADIMGKPTDFVYENPCFGQHETYMEPIYKNYPEDCDTHCGSHIEMPWNDLTVPRNIKLRVSKKPKSDQKASICDPNANDDNGKTGEGKEVIVCECKDENF